MGPGVRRCVVLGARGVLYWWGRFPLKTGLSALHGTQFGYDHFRRPRRRDQTVSEFGGYSREFWGPAHTDSLPRFPVPNRPPTPWKRPPATRTTNRHKQTSLGPRTCPGVYPWPWPPGSSVGGILWGHSPPGRSAGWPEPWPGGFLRWGWPGEVFLKLDSSPRIGYHRTTRPRAPPGLYILRVASDRPRGRNRAPRPKGSYGLDLSQ